MCQSGAVLATVDAWLDAMRSTERCDRPAAEAAVRRAHVTAGLAEPDTVVWMDSPLGGLLARTALVLDGAAPRRGTDQLYRLCDGPLWDAYQRLNDAEAPGWEWPCELTGARDEFVTLIRGPVAELVAPLGQAVPRAYGHVSGSAGLPARVPLPVREAIQDALGGGVPWDGLVEATEGMLRDPLFDPNEVALSVHIDAYALAGAEAASAAAGLDWSPVLGATAAALRAVGSWWPLGEAVVLCERPTVQHLDGRGRPHRVDGPAVRYADGWCARALDGLAVKR